MSQQSRELIVSLELRQELTAVDVGRYWFEVVQLNEALLSLVELLRLRFAQDCREETAGEFTDEDEAECVRFVDGEDGQPASIFVSSPVFADEAKLLETRSFIWDEMEQFILPLPWAIALQFQLD